MNKIHQLNPNSSQDISQNSKSATLSSPWVFFAAVFAWTWFFWAIAIVLQVSMESAAGFVLLFLGVAGPMVGGITFTYLTKDKAGRRDYWVRIIDPRRIGFKWFLVIILFVPFSNGVAALIDLLLGGTGAVWGEAIAQFSSQPFAIIPSLLFASLIPFIEELGWRGYVQDRVQAKWTALVSSLILGVVWSLWHLPLFFVPDTYQSGLGVGTLNFWLFMFGVVPLCIPFTWIYNNTRRSILAAIIFHAMINFTGELIAVTERADVILIGLWFVAAIVITLIWGPKTLTRGKAAA